MGYVRRVWLGCQARWRLTRAARWLQRARLAGRLEPVSHQFGCERGQPVDRYFIERFLKAHGACIRGRVLEIGDNTYTRACSAGGVVRSDVLNAQASGAPGEIVGDLTRRDTLPAAAYDCIILTQVLNFIYDWQAAIDTAFHALKDGGCLLVTVSGIAQVSRYDMDRWGDYWRFTDAGVRRAFCEVFGAGPVQVATHGNVWVACAALHGLAAHELSAAELDHTDADYPVVVTVVAWKQPSAAGATGPAQGGAP